MLYHSILTVNTFTAINPFRFLGGRGRNGRRERDGDGMMGEIGSESGYNWFKTFTTPPWSHNFAR